MFPLTSAIGLLLGLSPSPAEEPPASRELAPGIFAMPSSDRFGSANVGWVAFEDHVLLIGAHHPDLVTRCLEEARRTSGKPVRGAVFTHARQGGSEAARLLAQKGISLVAQREASRLLRAGLPPSSPGADSPPAAIFQEFADRIEFRSGKQHIEILGLGDAAGPGSAAVYAPEARVLFTGGLCANGPRALLAGSNTARWIHALEDLEKLGSRTVVPGFGSIGGPEILIRQRRFLLELRRQVGHLVAQGRPLESVRLEVRIEPEWLVWMPYDHPAAEDIEHVYRELTLPKTPFGSDPFSPSDPRPRALALIADRFHEPAHIEAGLGRAFEEAGVQVRFTVDVRALTAENLKAVQVLVMLRDGMLWPDGPGKPYRVWMAPEQERAVVEFVEAGGGLLVLHNSLGIYPEGGPYLKLAGGTYQGHGPLERFRVKVVDPHHPITRGVSGYEIADEQHTPTPDRSKVHLLLESRSDEGVVAAAGWAHEAGKGRVSYLANGHTRDSLAHAMVQLLLRNAVLWCLKRDQPEGAGSPH